MKPFLLSALLLSGLFAQTTTYSGTVTTSLVPSSREVVSGANASVQLDITYPELPDDQSYPALVNIANDSLTIIRNFPNRTAGPETVAMSLARQMMEKYPLITGISVQFSFTTVVVQAQRVAKTLPAAAQAEVAGALAEARRSRRP